MKKTVAIILSLVLLSFSVAMAENLSFSDLSDEELTVIYENALNEMAQRGLLASGTLSPGKYVVGVDLTEGVYSISAADSINTYYCIFPTQEAYDTFNELKNFVTISIRPFEVGKDQPVRIDLQAGSILYLPTNSAKIERINDTLRP